MSTKHLYAVTVRVPAKSMTPLLEFLQDNDLVAEFGSSEKSVIAEVIPEPATSTFQRKVRRHFVGGKRIKEVGSQDLIAQVIIDNDCCSISLEIFQQAFVANGYSPTSASSAISKWIKAGFFSRNGDLYSIEEKYYLQRRFDHMEPADTL